MWSPSWGCNLKPLLYQWVTAVLGLHTRSSCFDAQGQRGVISSPKNVAMLVDKKHLAPGYLGSTECMIVKASWFACKTAAWHHLRNASSPDAKRTAPYLDARRTRLRSRGLSSRCLSEADRWREHHVAGAVPGQRGRAWTRAALGRALRAAGSEQGRTDRCERAARRTRRAGDVVELGGGGAEKAQCMQS